MPSRRPLLGAIGKHVVFFDGVDDYVKVPHSDSLAITDTITITVFARALEYRTMYLLNKNTGLASWSQQSWRITFEDSGKIWFVLVDSDGNAHVLGYTGYNPDWTMYTFTYDGQYMKIYINGTQVASLEDNFTLNVLDAPLYIGIAYSSTSYFYGEIAYVLIYNRALSDDEIAQIYNDIKDFSWDNPITDGLVLGLTPYSLDCENGIWNDISGNGNNATLYGARCLWI